MAELASDSIGADAVFPEAFASPVFMEFILARNVEDFMFSMREPALVSVVAESQLGECLAQFSLVFKGVSFEVGSREIYVLLSV
jgi:hypothetical protein